MTLQAKKYEIKYIRKHIKDDIYFYKNYGYFRYDTKTTEFFDDSEGLYAPQKVSDKRNINTVGLPQSSCL